MKKVILFLFVLSCVVLPGKVFASENIKEYAVTMTLSKDGDLFVQENIAYDFSDAVGKHGIIRNIPLNKVPGAFENISISDFSAVDPFTDTYYNWSDQGDIDEASYKIGDAETTVAGVKNYSLNYHVSNSLGYFSEFTELYWNVIGTEWKVPINNAAFYIYVPIDVKPDSVKVYCGKSSSKENCATFDKQIYDAEGGVQYNLYSFVVNKASLPLDPGEGITVALAMPRGSFTSEPSLGVLQMRRLKEIAILALIGIIPLVIALLFCFFRIKNFLKWHAYKKRNTIIAEYDSGIYSPMEAETLYRGVVTSRGFSAEIANLVVQKYVDLRKNKEDILEFVRTDKVDTDLSSYQKIILENISNKALDAILGDILFVDKVFTAYKSHVDAQGMVGGTIKIDEKQSFSTSIFILIFLLINPGIFIFFGGSVIGLGLYSWLSWAVTCILIFLLTNVLGREYILSLSDAGLEAKRKILGLREYIHVAEKERIMRMPTSEEEAVLVEKLLPYAIIFNMEDNWAKHLEIVVENNQGDQTLYNHLLISRTLVTNVSGFNTTFRESFLSSAAFMKSSFFPRSGSGSGSFGSHSGSSGGGGGGGGGGSW